MTLSRPLPLFLACIALAACSDTQIFGESTCSVDMINGSDAALVAIKRSNTVQMVGWAFDDLSKTAPTSITINLVSPAGVVTKLAEGKPTVARPDVSAMFNAPGVAAAGFTIEAKGDSQAAGTYEVHVLQHFSGRILVCKTNRRIRLD